MPTKPFPATLLAALHKSKIIGLWAGEAPHRFIGVWPVLVKDRLFVRPWNNKPSGWYAAFLKEPYGVLQVGEREVPIKTRKAVLAPTCTSAGSIGWWCLPNVRGWA